jgi:hypothetical protein
MVDHVWVNVNPTLINCVDWQAYQKLRGWNPKKVVKYCYKNEKWASSKLEIINPGLALKVGDISHSILSHLIPLYKHR